MKKIAVIIFLGISTIFTIPQSLLNDYELTWQDEFNDSIMDTTKWDYRLLGPRRVAHQVKEAVKMDKAGNLIITASKIDTQYHTGMISTMGKYETAYGYFECRAKLGRASGTWSAFWLTCLSVQLNDPDYTKNGTEIDIYEYFHYHPDKVEHNLHWGGYSTTYQTTGHIRTQSNLSTGWHTFAVLWTPTEYVFYVDDVESWRTSSAVSPVNEYMILSVEMEPYRGAIIDGQLPDTTFFDYVRVYKLKIDTTAQHEDTGNVIRAYPVEDGFVRGGTYASTTFGTSTDLMVKGAPDASYIRNTYLKFNFNEHKEKKLLSAKLRLYVKAYDILAPLTLNLSKSISNSWNESTLNWNNRPVNSELLTSFTVDTLLNSWVEVELLPFFQNGFATDSILTLRISDTLPTDRYCTFASKESTVNKPNILLTIDTTLSTQYEAGKIDEELQLQVSPNPFNPRITVRLNNNQQPFVLTIREAVSGRKVKEKVVSGSTYTWESNNNASGLYIIEASLVNRRIVKKVSLIR